LWRRWGNFGEGFSLDEVKEEEKDLIAIERNIYGGDFAKGMELG